jgi:hypothetical protein
MPPPIPKIGPNRRNLSFTWDSLYRGRILLHFGGYSGIVVTWLISGVLLIVSSLP